MIFQPCFHGNKKHIPFTMCGFMNSFHGSRDASTSQPNETHNTHSCDEMPPKTDHLPPDLPSIDEFLATYRHEMTSIVEFLSSLDDSNSVSSQVDKIIPGKLAALRMSTNSSSEAESVGSSCKSHDEVSAPPRKQARTKASLSAEAREEVRRIKNREYQRRFRERRRLHQYRSLADPTYLRF
jgi:hypothetical protein